MVILSITMFMVSCKESSTDPVVNEFDTLLNYMNDNGMTITDLTTDWIITSDATLEAEIANYYVMDIRTGDTNANGVVDYIDGHVPGAVASSYSTIVTDAEACGGKPIIVVCYTGQTASHAVMALRLSGFSDAKVLKWGMSSWHSDFDSWTANTATLGHTNWEAAPGSITASETFDYPIVDTGSDDGAEILKARVATLLTDGFKGIAGINVLDSPADYFVNNYWALSDVEHYGHISGAYRIQPLVLENLNPAETIVTYCWTGQTSSMVTAYLTVLGYDAKSLKFGSNGMIYDNLESHKWSTSADFAYETGE